MTDELKTQLNALTKKHGKRKVKKAVNQLFAEWGEPMMTKKEREYKEIAEGLYNRHPKPVGKQQTIKNIVSLLRRGVRPEYLDLAVDRYIEKLKYQKKRGKPIPSEFWWQSNNFFGAAAYWQECLTCEELEEAESREAESSKGQA